MWRVDLISESELFTGDTLEIQNDNHSPGPGPGRLAGLRAHLVLKSVHINKDSVQIYGHTRL